MRTKKQTQQDHAKRRFGERLGIRFSQYVNDMLLHKIHSGQTKIVEKQSNRVSVYEVVFLPRQQDMMFGDAKEMTVFIVYDKMRKQIVTVSESVFDCIQEREDERCY